MTRALFLFLACLATLLGCNTQRTICPAYQSAFLFDKSAERKAFLVYNDNKNQPQEILASNSKTFNLPPRDSTWDKSVVIQAPSLPIERRVKKDRYLLLPQKTYRKALRALQTVPMRAVYPKKVVDSTDIKKALDSAARSITDTLSATANTNLGEPQEDSVYVITKEKEKFNVDQDNYMWYFRDILVLPDVRIAMEDSKAEKTASGSSGKKTKESFFKKLKGLFKKKPKQENDTTRVVREEVNPNDSTASSQPKPVLKKKKGLGGLFGKKQKAPAVAPKKPEGKKEEDDGF